MSHRFFKYSNNTSGLPGRVASSLWEKITKKAHDVWSIGDEGGSPTVSRMRAETVNSRAEPVHAHPELNGESDIDVGEIVLLFMGGRQFSARVAGIDGGDVKVEFDGCETTVPRNWLVKQADERSEDPKSMVADSLKKLLQSRHGQCAIRISPSTMMALIGSPDGQIQVRMFEVSTKQFHSGVYPSVDAVVKDLNLTNYPEEINLDSLLRQR